MADEVPNGVPALHSNDVEMRDQEVNVVRTTTPTGVRLLMQEKQSTVNGIESHQQDQQPQSYPAEKSQPPQVSTETFAPTDTPLAASTATGELAVSQQQTSLAPTATMARAASQSPATFAPPEKPNPHGSPTRVYINQNVTPHLLEGMKYVAAYEPEKPLRWLSEFLARKSAELEG